MSNFDRVLDADSVVKAMAAMADVYDKLEDKDVSASSVANVFRKLALGIATKELTK